MFRKYFEFAIYRSFAELKREASRMYLGVLWWILEPALYLCVFYLVFGVGLRKGGSEYALFLLAGLLPWKWFESSVKTASTVILGSSGLMKHVYFPKIILPGYIVLTNFYKFLIIQALFFIFLYFRGLSPSIYWMLLPFLMGSMFLFISGVAGICAAMVPIIPDFRHIVNYSLQMAFFLSGIFFSLDELDPLVRNYLEWNPVVIYIDAYRAVLLYSKLPDIYKLLTVTAISLLLFGCMVKILNKLDRYFPRVIA